jgi:chromosome segregation ATPase
VELEKVVSLVEELRSQRARTAVLCAELESTANSDRFRLLDGDDQDTAQLSTKLSLLDARLDEKKGILLEKKLALEEMTTLTQKLKNRAGEGRETTLLLTAKVNDYQGRIRDVTRRMMALVSELSMYQATAMKLQQEKASKLSDLDEAKWRVAHGQPPSDDAEREWFQHEHAQLARAESKLLSKGQVASLPLVGVRTTAEPRPTAYIPDELGIPRPYGGLAPFKPSEVGSTMRHTRAPVPSDIVI